MISIAHISDLHFGRAHPLAAAALQASLAASGCDVVVISGDITQSGRRREFAEARRFLAGLKQPFVAVPGNHDAPVYNLAERFIAPWRRFSRDIGRVDVAAARPVPGVALIGVNTARRAAARMNWAFGRFSERKIAAVRELAQARRAEGDFVMLVCHHPFVTAANHAGSEIVGNGERALDAFAGAGVALAFTGHTHLSAATPIAAVDGRILSVQAGTAMSTRMRGDGAAYNRVSLSRDENGGVALVLEVMRWSETGFAAGPSTRFSYDGDRWTRNA